jgi:hypothetical protein
MELPMKKLLLASAFALVPIIAFAGGGGAISGNLSGAASMSASGIAANQGTAASVNTKGNGLAVEGAVAGNYATITSTGAAKAGKAGVTTGASTTEAQVGGVIAGGVSFGKAGGGASGNQSTTVLGGSTAAAGNLNGFVAAKPNQGHKQPVVTTD